MSWQVLPMVIAALAVGVVGKGRVEDEVTAASDSFTRWDTLFVKWGNANQVPWHWLKAIAMNESQLGEDERVARGLADDHDPDSVSSDGKSWGLMQLTLPTARDHKSPGEVVEWWTLNNPETSIRIAAAYLRWVMRQFDLVDLRYQEWVIKSYNQGVGNTQKERAGTGGGFADDYWTRFQRNIALIERKQGTDGS